MELIQFNSFKAEYSENLLPNASLLKGNPTINSDGCSVSAENVNAYSKNANSAYFHTTYGAGTSYEALFNFGTSLEKAITKNGNYIFQFAFLNQTNYDQELETTITLEVYIDDLLYRTFSKTLDLMTLSKDIFYNFTQSFDAYEDQVVNFKFKVESPFPGIPDPVVEMYFSGFKLEIDDRKLNMPSLFTEPPLLLHLWQSRVDEVNTQSLTLATDNLFAFTGTSESNDSFTLITTGGVIQPTKAGNVITIDTAFLLTTPAGADHYIDLKLVVNGFTYRGKTVTLIKGEGNTDFISVSWTLPVGADFFTFGGKIYLRPDATCTIANRYISIVEQSNP